MRTANEIVRLLVKSTGTWLFEDGRLGLTNREWAALRFPAHANRFSSTPSASFHHPWHYPVHLVQSFERSTKVTPMLRSFGTP